jgi:hypothetical protein
VPQIARLGIGRAKGFMGEAGAGRNRIVLAQELPYLAAHPLHGGVVDGIVDIEPGLQRVVVQRLAFGQRLGKDQDFGARRPVELRWGIDGIRPQTAVGNDLRACESRDRRGADKN